MKLHRRTLLAGATGTLAAAAASRRALAQQASGPIRLPVLIPLTGPVGIVGAMTHIGAEVTAEYINKQGGVRGRMIELVFRDDKSNPNEAAAAARELIGDGSNILIAGQITSTALPVISIARELNALYINIAGQAMSFSHELFTPNMFLCSDNEYQRIKGFAEVAVRKQPDAQNWGAILTDSDVYVNSYANFQRFLKEAYATHGKQVSFAEPIRTRLGTTDFRTQLTQLASMPIDALFQIVVGSDAVTLWQQARPYNLGSKLKLVIDQSVEVPAGKALKRNLPPNLWTIFMWYAKAYPDNAISRALQAGWVARTKEDLASGYVQYGSLPVLAAAEAISAADGATDTPSLIRALEGRKFQTAKGEMYFRREDHLIIGDIDYVQFAGLEQEPGYTITESLVLPGAQLAPPATPGVAFSWS